MIVSTYSCQYNCFFKEQTVLFYYQVNSGCTSTTYFPFQDGRHSWTSMLSTRKMATSLNLTDNEVKSDVAESYKTCILFIAENNKFNSHGLLLFNCN